MMEALIPVFNKQVSLVSISEARQNSRPSEICNTDPSQVSMTQKAPSLAARGPVIYWTGLMYAVN